MWVFKPMTHVSVLYIDYFKEPNGLKRSPVSVVHPLLSLTDTWVYLNLFSLLFRLGFCSLVCTVVQRVWNLNEHGFCMHRELLFRMDCLHVVIAVSKYRWRVDIFPQVHVQSVKWKQFSRRHIKSWWIISKWYDCKWSTSDSHKSSIIRGSWRNKSEN